MVGRLFQIVYLLMEKESLTAKELAEKLEVSVRTINRDIEKLSEARIPIYATRGRGGGVSLLSDFVLNKTVLSEEEKSGILSSMRLMGTVAYEDEKQALRRLEDFFGEVAQDWIEIQLDTWNEGNFEQERFKEIKNAILSHKKIEFDYHKKGIPGHRKIRPHKLVFRAQAWYVYGFCEEREDFRYFKFSRMTHLEILEERFQPMKMPIEKKQYLPQMTGFTVKIKVDLCMAYRVYDEIPVSGIEKNDDHLICTIPNATDWIYGYIFSFGPYAEVLEPMEIRLKMKEQIQKTFERY